MSAWDGLSPPYATIVADPPWAYRVSRITARTGDHKNGAEDHPRAGWDELRSADDDAGSRHA